MQFRVSSISSPVAAIELFFLIFSIVWQEDGLLHTTCGTPNYVAPEVGGRGEGVYLLVFGSLSCLIFVVLSEGDYR